MVKPSTVGKLMTTPFTRKRTLSAFSGNGIVATTLGGLVSFDSLLPYNIVTKQITSSRKNPGWLLLQRLKKNPRYRKLPKAQRAPLENRNFGGNFDTERQRHRTSHRDVFAIDRQTVAPFNVRRTYSGPLFALRSSNTGATSGFSTITPVSEAEMIARGTKFIASTIPTNPVAGVAQILGELREGLPKIPGKAFFSPPNRTALGALRQSGSEYVNIQFAALPLVKDVLDIAKAVKESDKILNQYTRDSGRHIRRRASLPVVTETTTTLQPGDRFLAPGLASTFYSQVSGPLWLTRTVTTKWTFSACYTYYLDPGKTALGRLNRQAQLANKLAGTRITPELLWELTPWSWAADYVGNIGDVLTNVSALMSDSLVIRWAYVMCEQHIIDTYVQTGVSFRYGPSGPFSQTFETIRKSRRMATPYGFGLNPDAFTARQWAVIGALGISKGPRQL